MQRSSFFGRNSLSCAFSPKFRYRLLRRSVLASSFPRNPNIVAPFGRIVFSRGSAASVVRLAAVPLSCCARSFALVPAPFSRANSHKRSRLCSSNATCVLPILPSVVQAETQPYPQQRSPPPFHFASLHYTALGLPQLWGARGGSRKSTSPCFPSFILPCRFQRTGDDLRLNYVNFSNFLVLFSILLNTLFRPFSLHREFGFLPCFLG